MTAQGSGSAAFQALADGETMVDQVTYTIADRHGAQASSTVQVTVSGRNDAPMAAADAAAGNEDAPLTIAALANDRDPDLADRLGVVAVDGHAVAPGGQVTLNSGAVVSVAGDGSLLWDPRDAFASLSSRQTGSDAFTYTVGDGHGGASTARIEVSVAGRNDAPSVGADAVSATAGTRLTMAATTLLANDHDIDAGDSLHLVSVDGSGATGTVSLDGAGITWDAADHYRGLGEGETAADTFVYRVVDNDGAVSSGTGTVTVHGVNDAPVAVNDTGVTDEDTAVTLRVLGNDSDPDVHDQLSLLSVDTAGTQGQVTINGDGSLTYDPAGRFDALNAGDTATDTFHYTVSDDHGGSSEASASITITGRSDTERLVDSFETAFSASNRTGAAVTVVDQHVETDGAHGLYKPTDGAKFARLEATGTTAAQTETFLGQPAGALPKDSDGTFPAQGSAAKLTVAVQAGDMVSFDWMFDARDFVSHPADGKADNDFAVFSVTGDGTPQLYLLSDVRHTGDQGASGWRTSVFTTSHSGSLTIGFACINDRIAGSPVTENSVLLVDNLRLNRAFGPGYQVVDTQGDGHFETLMHT
ncbi:MAG: Ig-like domain-containing protein [Rhodospirillales bacterium]